jgi:hypothetical protein
MEVPEFEIFLESLLPGNMMLRIYYVGYLSGINEWLLF